MAKSLIAPKEYFYDSIADKWEPLMNKYELQKRKSIVFNRLLKDISLKNKTFLDIGAGLGIFSCHAKELGAKVTAIEVGKNLIIQIKNRCKVKTIQADATSIPIPRNSYDLVLSTEVIEHTRNPGKAIKEAARVLKKNGFLVLTTPNKSWKFLFDFLSFVRIRPYHGNENWLSYKELKRYIEINKLTIEKETGFNFIIPIKPLGILEDMFKPSFPIFINHGFLLKK